VTLQREVEVVAVEEAVEVQDCALVCDHRQGAVVEFGLASGDWFCGGCCRQEQRHGK
jgi:hypothetical protein